MIGAIKTVGIYVEDQELNLRLVERILAHRRGYELISAMEGGLALGLFGVGLLNGFLRGGLLQKRSEEAVREKMQVRVSDGQRSPGRLALRHARGHGRAPGIRVSPVASANCVRPATLLTCNLRIMVLR